MFTIKYLLFLLSIVTNLIYWIIYFLIKFQNHQESHSFSVGQLVTNCFSFLRLRISSFLTIPEGRTFLLDIRFLVGNSFLQHWKSVTPSSASLHGFWWEIQGHLVCFSSTCNVLFLDGCLKNFSLSWVFINLTLMCLGMNFFGLIMFGVFPASWICKFWGPWPKSRHF